MNPEIDLESLASKNSYQTKHSAVSPKDVVTELEELDCDLCFGPVLRRSDIDSKSISEKSTVRTKDTDCDLCFGPVLRRSNIDSKSVHVVSENSGKKGSYNFSEYADFIPNIPHDSVPVNRIPIILPGPFESLGVNPGSFAEFVNNLPVGDKTVYYGEQGIKIMRNAFLDPEVDRFFNKILPKYFTAQNVENKDTPRLSQGKINSEQAKYLSQEEKTILRRIGVKFENQFSNEEIYEMLLGRQLGHNIKEIFSYRTFRSQGSIPLPVLKNMDCIDTLWYLYAHYLKKYKPQELKKHKLSINLFEKNMIGYFDKTHTRQHWNKLKKKGQGPKFLKDLEGLKRNLRIGSVIVIDVRNAYDNSTSMGDSFVIADIRKNTQTGERMYTAVKGSYPASTASVTGPTTLQDLLEAVHVDKNDQIYYGEMSDF